MKTFPSRSFPLICALAALGTGPGALADDAGASGPGIYDLSLETLSDVVVTDTKIAQSRESVTQKLETIRSADIEQWASPRRNIAEILQYVAGQFVNPLSRNDANWGSYAGLGPKYNTYLLDGLPIDSFADAMSLDPWAFQEVEVYKGPASVLYSNYLSMDFAGNEMSLAGITNFILKDRIHSASTRISAGGGSHGTACARVYHQNLRGGLSYFVGGSFEYSDYTNYGTPDSWLHMLKDPRYTKSKVYAKVSCAFGGDSQNLSLFVHRTDHQGDFGRPERDFKNHYETVNAAYTNQISEDWNLQVKTGYRNYDRSWEEDNYPASLTLRERDGVSQEIFPSDMTVTFRHAGDSMLTMGADMQLASYRTWQVENDVDARSYGAFLQEKYVRGRWVLRAGGRASDTRQTYNLIDGAVPGVEKKSWDSQLWSAGARFNASPALSFYGNVGSSYLAPSAKSVCGTIAASDAGVPGRNGQLPNPGLGPEKGLGSDLGVEFHLAGSLSVGIRGFLNRIDDAIVENVVSTVPSQTMSVNAGEAESCGFEVMVEQVVSPDIRWFANFTWTSSEVKNSADEDQDGTDIPFVPDYVANAGISVNCPCDITVTPCIQIVGSYYDSTSRGGRQRFGSYEVLNVRMQGVLLTRPEYALRWTLDLNNLLDQRYEMPWQFRDPGFNVFAGVEADF